MLLYACTRKLDGHSLFEERHFFWPRHAAFGILVPWQGIEHMPPAVKVQSLNHWTAREIPDSFINNEVLTDGPMEK